MSALMLSIGKVNTVRQPNHLLREARLRQVSPSRSGQPLSRQELADALNAWLFDDMGREFRLDAGRVARWEQDAHRSPGEDVQRALRAVLGAGNDSDLGLSPIPKPCKTSSATAFGARLRELRVGRGLSFRRLGRLVHYSHGYLWDLETGSKQPTAAVASALDTALDANGELSALALETKTPPALERETTIDTVAKPATEASASASFEVAAIRIIVGPAVTLTIAIGETGVRLAIGTAGTRAPQTSR